MLPFQRLLSYGKGRMNCSIEQGVRELAFPGSRLKPGQKLPITDGRSGAAKDITGVLSNEDPGYSSWLLLSIT